MENSKLARFGIFSATISFEISENFLFECNVSKMLRDYVSFAVVGPARGGICFTPHLVYVPIFV